MHSDAKHIATLEKELAELEYERDCANAYAYDRMVANEVLQRRHLKHLEMLAKQLKELRRLKKDVAALTIHNNELRRALLRTLDIRKPHPFNP
jgi:hypothetical protein